MKTAKNIYNEIISPENLFLAWDEFKKDKKNKKDVMEFEWKLEENIFKLHKDLKAKRYKHGAYQSFNICDPKPRHIHKASVRDRILHHAIFSVLNPIFEPTFTSSSFSCRIGFGTHKGIGKLHKMVTGISKNGFQKCFILKCDIKKFFDTIDHDILLTIIKRRIKDPNTIWLLEGIINSFDSYCSTIFEHKGLPIGNLTSQLFANIYMNEFDQFMKHKLKVKHYVRYTDDFTIASNNKGYLLEILPNITSFLTNKLTLELHPNKIMIRKLNQGIDFLGQVIFTHHRLIRPKTKRRMLIKLWQRMEEYRAGKITRFTLDQSLQSYLGVLSHASAYTFGQQLKNQFWFNSNN